MDTSKVIDISDIMSLINRAHKVKLTDSDIEKLTKRLAESDVPNYTQIDMELRYNV